MKERPIGRDKDIRGKGKRSKVEGKERGGEWDERRKVAKGKEKGGK